MTYKYDFDTNMLMSKNKNIQLVSITFEEIKKLRISKSNFLIFKRGKNVYSFEGHDKKTIITFKNFYHKCPHCKEFLRCPKVMERELDPLTEENYKDSCRIEKYPFILLGYEQPDSFYVWKCKKYVPTQKVNPPKKNIANPNNKDEIPQSNNEQTEDVDTSKDETKISGLITEAERMSLAFPDRKKHQELIDLGKIIRDISP